jgi:hypothetical protein
LAKEKLTADEIKNKLLATDNTGMTAWHAAAERGNLEILQEISNLAKEKLTADEVKNKLLLATDGNGMMAWHAAAQGQSRNITRNMEFS